MHILHVIPTIALVHGGPSYAVRRMAKTVAALGHDVDVVATSFGTPHGARDPSRTWVYDEDGVTYRLFPRTGPWAYNLSIDLTRWLFPHARDYDVLHVHAPFSYSTLAASHAATLARVPYVLRTLGTMDPWSLQQKSWKKWPYYRLFEHRNMTRAASVHVTAESERAAVASLGFGDKARVVPLAVDVGPKLARAARTKGAPLRVLYLSRLHEKKGVEHLLDAVKALLAEDPNAVRLVLAGSGEPAYEAHVNALIARLGLAGSIERPGFVDGDAKLAVLRDADVFVLPAYDENFGIAVVEAMAAGLPVIVSDGVGVAPEVARGGAGIVTRTGSSADVADALRRFQDDATRTQMGIRARQVVEETFTTAAMGSRLVAMYEAARGAS